MQENNSNFAILFIKRLKSALKISRDIELAELLGIKQNTISGWKNRNSVDMQLIIKKFPDIDVNYLIKGKKDEISEVNISNYDISVNDKKMEYTTQKCLVCVEKERTIATQLKLIASLEKQISLWEDSNLLDHPRQDNTG